MIGYCEYRKSDMIPLNRYLSVPLSCSVHTAQCIARCSAIAKLRLGGTVVQPASSTRIASALVGDVGGTGTRAPQCALCEAGAGPRIYPHVQLSVSNNGASAINI